MTTQRLLQRRVEVENEAPTPMRTKQSLDRAGVAGRSEDALQHNVEAMINSLNLLRFAVEISSPGRRSPLGSGLGPRSERMATCGAGAHPQSGSTPISPARCCRSTASIDL